LFVGLIHFFSLLACSVFPLLTGLGYMNRQPFVVSPPSPRFPPLIFKSWENLVDKSYFHSLCVSLLRTLVPAFPSCCCELGSGEPISFFRRVFKIYSIPCPCCLFLAKNPCWMMVLLWLQTCFRSTCLFGCLGEGFLEVWYPFLSLPFFDPLSQSNTSS